MNQEKMEIIDFHGKFTRDFIAWSNKHPEISGDEDKLEIAAERAREKWYNSNKSWLNGATPNEYFHFIKDAAAYVTLFIRYIEEGLHLPEPLMDCIVEGGEDIYNILLGIIELDDNDSITPEAFDEVRAEIIAIIEEMRMPHPYSRYLTLLLRQSDQSELSEALAAAFTDAEDTEYVRELLLSVYDITSGYTRLLLLDILCSMPDDDGKTADILLKELACDNLELAVVAGYEAAIMDERALPLLRQYIEDTSIDYYTYSELRYAIEAITGELIDEKDFTGDDDYDKIAGLREEDIFG